MAWLIAQDLTIDPSKVAEELGKAQNVQQVLAVVVGALLVFLIATILFHIREQRRWEAKADDQAAKVLRTWKRVERAISALAGLGDSLDPDDEE